MLKNFSLITIVSFLLINILFLLRLIDPTYSPYLYAIIRTIFGLMATLICGYLLKKYQFRSFRRLVLTFIILASFTWVIGDTIIDLYASVLNRVPFPSIADVFYLLGYILYPLGIYFELKENADFFKKISWQKKLLFALPIVVGFAIALKLWHAFMFDNSTNASHNLTTFIYILGDMVVLTAGFFAIYLAKIYQGGKIANMWLWIFAQFIVLFIADMFYVSLNASYELSVWPIRQLIDVAYSAVYLFQVLAFISLASSLEKIKEKIGVKT